MKDKYYTPEIEEFHVGFEYEVFQKGQKEEENVMYFMPVQTEDAWYKFTYPDPFYGYRLDKLFEKKLRVKYLDKEDIESLGFIDTGDEQNKDRLSYQSPKTIIGGPSAGDDFRYIFLYSLNDHELWVYKAYNNGYEDDLFKGIIKNKSEFKKLLKQLNTL